ncbi:MAG: hypothetical protein ACK559_30705, partial [bacterium]
MIRHRRLHELIPLSDGCSDHSFLAEMRTQIVLIDFENVQPDKLTSLVGDHFRVVVFVGAHQTRIPFEIADWLQRLGLSRLAAAVLIVLLALLLLVTVLVFISPMLANHIVLLCCYLC